MTAVSDLVSRWHIGRIHPTPDAEPEGWTLERLCDIARLESGHTPSRNRPDYWNGGIPWLSLHDSKAIEGNVLQNTKMTVSALGLANSSARLLPEGTVALSRTATIGKVALLGREMATSQDFACYICGTRILNKYLAHLFRGMEVEWERLMAGSTHNTIYMPTFKSMQILVPPMEEQEAIAEALSDADALIEALERLIAKKRLIKQGAMQDLLTAKRRLPGFSGEWVKATFGEIGPFVGGGTPSMAREDFWTGGTIPWVSSSDVRVGELHSAERMITVSAVKGSSTRIVASGSILFVTRSGILRRFQPVMINTVPVAINQDIKALLPRNSVYSSNYIFHAAVAAGDQILRDCMKTGTTVESIDLNALRRFQIDCPKDQNEQDAIAGALSDMDAEIQVLETRLDKARQVKEGMMQNLLTGRIRLV